MIDPFLALLLHEKFGLEASLLKQDMRKEQELLREQLKKEEVANRPPFNLDALVEAATTRVQASIANSRHLYKELPSDHAGRSQGFVTYEGYKATQPTYTLDAWDSSLLVTLSGGSFLASSGEPKAGQIYVVTDKGLEWVDPPAPVTCSLAGFVVVRSSVPKFLARFIKEIK